MSDYFYEMSKVEYGTHMKDYVRDWKVMKSSPDKGEELLSGFGSGMCEKVTEDSFMDVLQTAARMPSTSSDIARHATAASKILGGDGDGGVFIKCSDDNSLTPKTQYQFFTSNAVGAFMYDHAIASYVGSTLALAQLA